MKIHNEASNIFSLEAFSDCNEINLRRARRIKKLDAIIFRLFNTEGKNNRNKK
jgi:hypothetical protein